MANLHYEASLVGFSLKNYSAYGFDVLEGVYQVESLHTVLSDHQEVFARSRSIRAAEAPKLFGLSNTLLPYLHQLLEGVEPVHDGSTMVVERGFKGSLSRNVKPVCSLHVVRLSGANYDMTVVPGSHKRRDRSLSIKSLPDPFHMSGVLTVLSPFVPH